MAKLEYAASFRDLIVYRKATVNTSLKRSQKSSSSDTVKLAVCLAG